MNAGRSRPRPPGLYTVFFTIDATRTELSRFLDIVERVLQRAPV